jgi:branched-chain amino acid transport system permease protein
MRIGVATVARLGLFVAAAAVIALLPAFVSGFRLVELAQVGVYVTALLGLNVLTGYSGQISLGHGAFMAVGAYTTAILASKHDVSDLATIPLAGIVAGAVGFAFGFPALRLSGAYLALATFGIAVALSPVVKRFDDFTGGSGGLLLPRIAPSGRWLYYLSWSIAGVLFVVAWALLRGRTGRAFRAVRDSEVAAVSSGISLSTYKTLAFGVSAFYAGVAGSLYAIAAGFVNPDTFPISLSILLLAGAVVGGLGSLWGVIVGALFIQFLPDYAQEISNQAPSVVYGVILILVLFVAPTGAAGLVRRGYARAALRAPAASR